MAASTPAANGTRAAPAVHDAVPASALMVSSPPVNAPSPVNPTRAPTSCTASVIPLSSFSDETGTANSTDADPAMYTSVVAAPAMKTPRGMVRSGSLISCPISEVISKPEKAKHIADQSDTVSSSAPRGTIVAAVNGVADPKRVNARRPQPINKPAGIHTPRLPAFCSHLPQRRPMMLMPAAIQIPTRTNSTEYHRDSPSGCQAPPPIAARLAAPNSSREGK